MEEDLYIFDDFWNILSLCGFKLFGSDFMTACKKLNIDLTSSQEQLLSDAIFSYDQWMNLFQNKSTEMNPSMDKWKKLHSHYKEKINRDVIEPTNNALCVYQWRLPRYLGYSASTIEVLCAGFIRQKTDIFIPDEIIGILMQFTFDNIMDKIKHSEPGNEFESEIFEYKSCKFQMVLRPKSRNEQPQVSSDAFIKDMQLSIVFMGAPKSINTMRMHFEVQVAEKFINSSRYWYDDAVPGEEMSFGVSSIDLIKHLDSMTINFSIDSFTAHGVDGQVIFTENDYYVTRVNRKPLLKGRPASLIEPAIKALTTIFKEFATNDDGTMSKMDFKRYIYLMGAGDASASDERVKAVFDMHGAENEDHWPLDGFLSFYKSACIDRPDHVWNDLNVMKFKNDFTRIDDTEKIFINPIILDYID